MDPAEKGLMVYYNVYISNQIDLRKFNNFFFYFPLLISRKIKDYCYELLSVSCQFNIRLVQQSNIVDLSWLNGGLIFGVHYNYR